MPEGDTILRASRRIGSALLGREILEIETPQPRHRMDRWPERLGGRPLRAVDTHGKHLFLRFDGGLTLHSHLRMTGMWGVYAHGQRWRRAPWRAWLVIRTGEHEVVQFDGPVLELMTDSRSRIDQRIASLGPDVLAPGFSEADFVARLRGDDQTRAIGDAVLDQRNVAGLGNIWKCESCFIAGLDPWRRVEEVSDEEALAIVREARPLMLESVDRGGPIVTWQPERPARGNRTYVYERARLPCRRCNTPVRVRGQGDDNRTTYWCPDCQR